jgi:purine nucleosidase
VHKVIFDTDPGIDDAMALLFLRNHPLIDVIGITTVFGNGTIEDTTRNALFLKDAWQIDATIAKGAGVPFSPHRAGGTPPRIVHGDNALGNVAVPEEVSQPDERPAYRFIIDAVRADPGNVVIVAVGRMTNLALALREDPEIAGLVRQVVIMGGAFTVPGNVSPVAEANIMGDPEAADMVLTAAWNVVVVGLDVTMKTVMTRATLADLAHRGSDATRLVADISQHYIDFYARFVDDGMVIHDACACAYVVAPELFTTRGGAMRVATDGVAVGQTIQKPDNRFFPPGPWDDKPGQHACIDVNADAVMSLIGATLVGLAA